MRTRELLLDATIDSLIELGYAKTSTAEVCARAGLSRGAQLHQFRTKAELLARAIEHLASKQLAQLRAAAEGIPAGTRPAHAVVDLVYATFAGPLGKATAELFTAIAEEQEMRQHALQVQRELTRQTLITCREAAPDADPERVEVAFWLTINLIRGFTLDEMLGRDRGRRARLLDEWKALAEHALAR